MMRRRKRSWKKSSERQAELRVFGVLRASALALALGSHAKAAERRAAQKDEIRSVSSQQKSCSAPWPFAAVQAIEAAPDEGSEDSCNSFIHQGLRRMLLRALPCRSLSQQRTRM